VIIDFDRSCPDIYFGFFANEQGVDIVASGNGLPSEWGIFLRVVVFKV
jgi:hypothetical protein